MTEANVPVSIGRVIIAVDTLRQSVNVLELGAKLASHRQIEMSVLFIEDVHLINLASLPMAREIDLVTAVDRELNNMEMMRMLQVQAQKTGRFLEELAARMNINYSFRVLRGDYLNEVLSVYMESDVLFLSKQVGRYGKLVMGKPGFSQPLKQVPGSGTAICVLYDGTAGSGRAIMVAQELATATGKPLVCVLQTDSNKNADQLRAQLASLPYTGKQPNQYSCISGGNDTELTRALQKNKCEVLVLHKNNREQLTGTLLEKSGCPIVVVQ